MPHEKGQSLIEVIVAATVGILVVTALTFATIFSLRNASFAKTEAQATKLAQEGIERVRTGRDRNGCIQNLSAAVQSWNDGNITCSGSGSIWGYQINSSCVTVPAPNCYFTVTNAGVLISLGSGSIIPTLAESVPPNFQRVVILSDNSSSYTAQKTVTVIVRWTDFAGSHESRLSTILRKL